MAFCTKCGYQLPAEAQVCSQCGNAVARRVKTATPPQEYAQPSPYIWASDSLPGANPPMAQPQAQPFMQPQYVSPLARSGYKCPRCNSQHAPVLESRISPAGWVVFGVMIFFCLPLCWIGLLIKEDFTVCPVCRCQLS